MGLWSVPCFSSVCPRSLRPFLGELKSLDSLEHLRDPAPDVLREQSHFTLVPCPRDSWSSGRGRIVIPFFDFPICVFEKDPKVHLSRVGHHPTSYEDNRGPDGQVSR